MIFTTEDDAMCLVYGTVKQIKNIKNYAILAPSGVLSIGIDLVPYPFRFNGGTASWK